MKALARLVALAALLLTAAANAQTTLSVSPAIVAPGGSVTATWSGIASPTGGDWLAMYTPGAPNGSYLAWRYTTGTASGSVPFTIPGGTAPGTYLLRLFSNNGFTLLATSNNFAVSTTVGGTVTVGGSPLAGVGFAATNGATCTTSNASGQYACAVTSGWSGSVTPSLVGYVFTPASRSYVNVTSSQSAQNYTATVTYQVSGTVTLNGLPVANVAMAATNGVACSSSNASGQYSCTAPAGWTGTVTPSQTGYTFTPTSRNYTSLGADDPGEDYTATLTTPAALISFIHVDHLDTPRLVANGASQAVWRWDQAEPFGVNVPDEDPLSLGVYEMPLRYPGQYFDKETNLHYNYFRDFDPGIGRYVQSDPIGLMAGLNTYAYVRGAPIRHSDSLGLNPGTAVGAGIGSLVFPGPGTFIGAGIGTVVGIGMGYLIYNENTSDERSKPPPGSKPIDETDWSGDHREIKNGVGAGPADSVKIDPSGNVWVEKPDGSWVNAGPAEDYTGSGQASGRKGKDRDKRRRRNRDDPDC